ncbi:HNH endonuclease [Glaciihabitans tibetensis]|uniref:HNH endonuclease n=1 Tax=Glaciihabitans tibetensis TaxID=1266600 RepID=A0A2T0VBU6_9MICO|nr:HNH endonuclease signature motif containing protein [Glaciihabitans tibetensis]PRY67666.1 HNH endonuclease [Glaciihabitans tibetensis]
MALTFEHTAPVEHWTVPGVRIEPPVEAWALPPTATEPVAGGSVAGGSVAGGSAEAGSVPQIDNGANSAVSGDLVELLDQITRDLARAAELATATTGTECLAAQNDATVLSVLVRTEAVARLVGSVQISTAAVIDDRSPYTAGASGLSSRHGHRRAHHLIESVARISSSEATRRIRVATATRTHLTLTGDTLPAPYPAVSAALHSGHLSIDTSARIITGLDEARKHHNESDPDTEEHWQDSVRAAEAHLVDTATDTAPDTVAIHIRQWREALDPDGAEPREDDIRSRRGFRQGRERNGITRNTWDTTGEDTALLKALFAESDAAATPKFYCEDDALHLTHNGITIADPTETARLLNTGQLDITNPNITHPHTDGDVDPETTAVVTKVTDLRTREQRHADTMSGYLRAGLRASADTLGGTRSLAEVTAVVTAADLQSGIGVGWLDGVEEPVSLATIEQLACTGGIRTAILGTHGELLYLGHKRRLFGKTIRKAVAIRDGSCAWGDCHKPPTHCDVHHVTPWSHGGKTNIDNAVLLCPEHHRQIHTSPFTIKMVNGKPFLLAPRYLDPTQAMKALGKARYTTRNTNRMNR